ncbi:PE-PPE domain-containing protein [Mycobacterium sp. M1]|uniref:PE-PPE domain-containing protein n=1 Tax=Mycolicibacter acidiphilus TaxID=2835306 RepID=A0ABS5RK55_9MYCO|nr:PE-PPE domain-containing protein [Mycolicibacter acidiphilus]MBS9534417.1 PE-PPE domain-containing protein [Mycolicibacter acidiphilus]
MKRSTALTVALLILPAPAAVEHSAAAHYRIRLTDSSIPVDVAPLPGQGVALVMGGSGVPIPPVGLTQVAAENYLVPMGFGDYAVERLFTPEGLQTIEGINKQLPFDQSVAQGVTILETEIKKQIQGGHNVFVGGVSQSATINAMVEGDIHDGKLDGVDVSGGKLTFLSLGDPSNPNGGILERFNLPQDPNPSLPSLGLTFSGAAPADTGIPTTIYTLEYDGFADFPRYPINFLSDLNAVLGMGLVHPLYIQGLLAPGVGLTQEQIADAQVLDTSPGYDGGTTYLGIEDPNQLPLAQLIGLIAGRPIGDLLAPDLKVLVNLGYGADPYVGWSTTPADVGTPAGLFPSIDGAQWNTIMQALADGAKQGWNDFLADIKDPSSIQPDTLDALIGGLHGAATDSGSHSLADIAGAISALASTFNGMAASTNDVLNALTTMLPATDATLFSNFLTDGDLTNALGMPMAFDNGLSAVALGVEAFVLVRNLPTLIAEFNALL